MPEVSMASSHTREHSGNPIYPGYSFQTGSPKPQEPVFFISTHVASITLIIVSILPFTLPMGTVSQIRAPIKNNKNPQKATFDSCQPREEIEQKCEPITNFCQSFKVCTYTKSTCDVGVISY